ncbi:hypothetical protein GEMRC1_013634 [Eukaryota sp. GEM-RC1]
MRLWTHGAHGSYGRHGTTLPISSFRPQSRPDSQISSEIVDLVAKIGSRNLVSNPIVLVPGFFGTSLEQKWNNTKHQWYCQSSRDWNLSWISFSSFLPEAVKLFQYCFFNFVLLQTRPIGDYLKGDTFAIEHLNPGFKWKTVYMYLFIETLHRLGMKRGESVFALPYDLRHSVALNRGSLHDRLKDLTETAYYKNNNSSVVLLTHSMGALLTADFLARQPSYWKTKFGKRFIAVGAPFGGSPSVYHNVAIGEHYGVLTMSVDLAKRLFDKWTAIATITPWHFLYKDEVLLSIDDVQYSTVNVSQMYHRSDDVFAVQPETGPGVKVTVIGTTDIKVPRRYRFTSLEKGGFVSTVDKFSLGDGTVEVDSMIEITKHWQKHQIELITWVPVKGVSHADYFMTPSFVEKSIQLL